MSRPKRPRGIRFLGVAAVLVPLIYVVALLVPQSVPLLDANRDPLAESAREGYCVGEVFGATRGVGGSIEDCLAENGRSMDKDLDQVQKSFCEGLSASAGFPTGECIEIMQTRRFWPTLKGLITSSWNKRFPYPGSSALDASVQNDNSRTGEREITDRIGEDR